MRRLYKTVLCLCLAVMMTSIQAAEPVDVKVKLKTSKGDIVLKLYPDKAPLTVENFLFYVDSGHYNNLIFHRVIKNFMIQAGGMTKDMNTRSSSRKPVKNESSNRLANNRGTIAMARFNAPDSATSQFFINLVDNAYLNYRPGRPGYTVFGEVVEGMNIVDEISKVKTGTRGRNQNVPVEPVHIIKAEKLNAKVTDNKKPSA